MYMYLYKYVVCGYERNHFMSCGCGLYRIKMMELPLPPPPPINSFDDEYSLEEDGSYGVNESQSQETGEGQRVIYDPDFGDVESSLRWAFWLHSYGFGCLFFFLSFYSFFSILNLRLVKNKADVFGAT